MKATLPLLVLAGTAIAVPVPEEQAQQAQQMQQAQQLAQIKAALEAQLLDGIPILGPLLSGLLGGLTGGGGGGGLPSLVLSSGLPLVGGLLGGLGGGGGGAGGVPIVGGLVGGGWGGAALPLPLPLSSTPAPAGASFPTVQATSQDAAAAIQKRSAAYAQSVANYYAALNSQINQEALTQLLTDFQDNLEKIKHAMAEAADKTPEEKAEAVRAPLEQLDADLKVGVSRLVLPGVSGLNGLPFVGQATTGVLGGGPGGPIGIVSGILKLVTDLLTSLLSSGPVGGGGLGGFIGGGGLLNEVIGGTGIGGTVGGLIFNSPISGLLQSILGTVGSVLPGLNSIIPVQF
ncbi:uncharacterized protein PODANS_1_10840 [Podospora anserina S mat+]|uniref:Podospora anserina S mat+ genomic DNA chromosome 1, supercontig 2 n=1 Tax=Podospora anserina (strain S / ATCC MYA-4624 / DSM 980 / FGSC 10383) TaxID=515849 RepID=B2AYE6_PODAN|nr:uncharacterized protein PODANS_1_10840 [Podospora anserina S mat+]CAP69420.1 unnamed protein product [Podospora anserina S mat+]